MVLISDVVVSSNGDSDTLTTLLENTILEQPSATSPLFLDNLHFEHFDKSVNHESTLKYLSKCSKWRLSKKRGLVADGCFRENILYLTYWFQLSNVGTK
jgi:hypothetical protein